MVRLREDRNVTDEKLDTMELLHPSDKRFLYSGEGMKSLLVDDTGVIVVYLCMFQIDQGNYGCFLIPSVLLCQYKVQVSRMVRRIFELELSKLKDAIVQTVSKNVTIINRWMEFLKFSKGKRLKVSGFTDEYFVWRRSSYGH